MVRLWKLAPCLLLIACQKPTETQPAAAPVVPKTVTANEANTLTQETEKPVQNTETVELASCTNDKRVMPLEMPTTVAGALQKFSFHLIATEPHRLTRGMSTLTVELHDLKGIAKEVASLTVTPTMPDHGHGAQTLPVVTGKQGRFVVKQVDLFMPGVWRIGLKANNSRGETLETGAFFFCIDG